MNRIEDRYLDHLRRLARDGDSLTALRGENSVTATVHLGFDHGTYDSYPLCGKFANKATETTEETANCAPCARMVRALGLGHHIRDEGGWTGLWEPRRR